MGRESKVALVLVKLRVAGEDYFLVREHPKWGDWSVVGGHVERYEESDWGTAAIREADEELRPLSHELDFDVVALGGDPIRWGPVRSKSAQERPTTYEARYFFLKLKRCPQDLLSQLDVETYRLVRQSELESDQGHEGISDTLLRAREALTGGLSAVPLAWPESLDRRALPISEWNQATQAARAR